MNNEQQFMAMEYNVKGIDRTLLISLVAQRCIDEGCSFAYDPDAGRLTLESPERVVIIKNNSHPIITYGNDTINARARRLMEGLLGTKLILKK